MIRGWRLLRFRHKANNRYYFGKFHLYIRYNYLLSGNWTACCDTTLTFFRRKQAHASSGKKVKNIIHSRSYKGSILSATLLGLLLLPTANGQVVSPTWGSMDEWLSMSGARVGTALNSTVLAAGSLPSMSSWTLVDGFGNTVSSTPDFTVAPSVGTMGGSITVNGVTYPDGTATQSLALNDGANYTYLTTYSIPGGKPQVVANGFITFGWADLGFNGGGYMDLVVLGDSSLQGGDVVLQLTNGDPCYCVHIETVGGGGFIGRSADIEIVPLHRYSFSLLFDEINGLAQLAIFDPSNNFVQVGSTVTQQQNKGSTFSSLRFGNAEAGTSSGTTAYFEDLMLDWTNHIFPNAPNLGSPTPTPTPHHHPKK